MSKKIIALVLALLMATLCFALAGCKKDEAKSDMEYIKDKGTLLVGITDFAPMDYQEKGSDEWIGFDADLAKAFAKYLGVKVEFVVIQDWDQKAMELDNKTIDCVWNGMTITEEVKATMSLSKAYCKNAQVIVVKADVADQYQTAEACKDLQFAVENGSAGQDVADENGFKYTKVQDQASALLEVASGTSDAAIIDLLMADAMVGEGTGFATLTYTAKLNDEEYGVGFRTGSDLTDSFNEFYASAVADGTVDAVAQTYGISAESLIK